MKTEQPNFLNKCSLKAVAVPHYDATPNHERHLADVMRDAEAKRALRRERKQRR